MSIEARFRIPRGGDFILDVDLALPDSGVTAFFGPSGCGKTTLLRAIAGLEESAASFLRVGDTIWQNRKKFLPPHRRPLGYVFQEASLFDHLTVQHNLEYGMKRVPDAERHISLDMAIALLDIGRLLSRYPQQLSGGERQRVAIARALAVSPRILLMDEPLAALDLARKQEIMPYLERLNSELNIPILYVSHSPGEVSRLADYLVLMDNGQVTATGPVTDLFTRLDLPLAHSDKAAALINVTVAEHDEHYSLTRLDFDGGSFLISRKNLAIGHQARLRVVARDVSLTLKRQTGTSILNIFPAIVSDVSNERISQVMVKLQVGATTMLSRITRKSADILALEAGKPVFAQVKTVALLS